MSTGGGSWEAVRFLMLGIACGPGAARKGFAGLVQGS